MCALCDVQAGVLREELAYRFTKPQNELSMPVVVRLVDLLVGFLRAKRDKISPVTGCKRDQHIAVG